MKLSVKHREEFKRWARDFFKENREASTQELYAELSKNNAKLAKKINRAAGKAAATTYVGRYLLRSFTSQGWLKHDGQIWVVQPADGFCTHCLEPLDPDIYMLDIDLNPYCDDQCFMEGDAVEPYDGYWDGYTNLFYEFDNLYPSIRFYSQKEAESTPLEHMDLLLAIHRLQNVLEDPDYNDI